MALVDGVRESGRAVVVPMPDVLDLSTVTDVSLGTAELIERYPVVVFDLSAVAFCDSQGLSCLIEAHRRCEAAGHELRLAAPSRPVRRLLGMFDPREIIPRYETVEAAMVEVPDSEAS